MFDPVEFIALAGELAAGRVSSRERTARARVRAAYGRAYYGLYLAVRSAMLSRHQLPHRRLTHGAIYTHLQSPRASSELRRIGRELQRLYELRQKADYDLTPAEPWRHQLADARLAATLSAQALALSQSLPRLDFSPVVPLFSVS